MAGEIANTDMAAAWDGDEGDDWARDWEHHDRSVREHHLALLDAARIGRVDRVLDVGCGNGKVTRDAARAASDGHVLGVDLSRLMLARARELARADGLANCRFEHGDAQVFPFEPTGFDVVVSRMGVMFFADPVAAFANIRTALRPGGRLALIAWRGRAENEWLESLLSALAVGRDLTGPQEGVPGPLGLADPQATAGWLAAAGLERIELAPVDLPFWLGPDADAAYEFFQGSGIVRGMTQGLVDADRTRALATLRATIDEHDTGEGVYFGSACWLIAAGRPG